MLAVSEQAATAIDGIIAANEMSEEAGVRLSREAGANGSEPGIRLELVDGPAPGDASLESAPVFLEPEVAEALDDKVLDAEIADEQVRFSVRPQGQG